MLSSLGEPAGLEVLVPAAMTFVTMNVLDFLLSTSSRGRPRLLKGPVRLPSIYSFSTGAEEQFAKTPVPSYASAAAVTDRCVMSEEGDWYLLFGDWMFLCCGLSCWFSRRDGIPGSLPVRCYISALAELRRHPVAVLR